MADPAFEVPPDQRRLPRHQRQHPYRWANEQERAEVRSEADAILRGIEAMLLKLARKRLRGRARQHVDDVVQSTRLKLFQFALPKFDQWRRPAVKLTTFLHTCATNAVADYARLATYRPAITFEPGASLEGHTAPDESHDRAIERIAADILTHPDQWVTPSVASHFPAVAGRGGPPEDADSHKFHSARDRLKARVRAIAAAEFG